MRRFAYRHKLLRKYHPGVPVIVVGNIVAGGSGKTPLVIALLQQLQQAGWVPGVASRGYGRDDAKTARWVDADSQAALSGDEPLLIALRTHAKVRVDVDRVAATRALVKAGCNIIICDDGLQHYRLARDIEIEVQDAGRRYGNGRLLPAGPLREPLERAADCTFRVMNWGVPRTGTQPENNSAGEWAMQLVIGDAYPLQGGPTVPLARFAEHRVHAVAGIGEPERFFRMLRDARVGVVPHAFSDHHQYAAEDLAFGSALPVLMTEKDAVKCLSFLQSGWYAVPVEAKLPDVFWQKLQAALPDLPTK